METTTQAPPSTMLPTRAFWESAEFPLNPRVGGITPGLTLVPWVTAVRAQGGS
ncbi:hypothetical protein DPMN_111354 [Dreissena polymorpha]|uniref:Uncharacterized protein n=1 Tax=Dreissena polymorpha TaxID=45954 RepID=A0A9D4KDP5_DREPO|nr:hypothetical protein DPMN_111354 [Dreissena polymorpha]